jgi:hypothetical protein
MKQERKSTTTKGGKETKQVRVRNETRSRFLPCRSLWASAPSLPPDTDAASPGHHGTFQVFDKAKTRRAHAGPCGDALSLSLGSGSQASFRVHIKRGQARSVGASRLLETDQIGKDCAAYPGFGIATISLLVRAK